MTCFLEEIRLQSVFFLLYACKVTKKILYLQSKEVLNYIK